MGDVKDTLGDVGWGKRWGPAPKPPLLFQEKEAKSNMGGEEIEESKEKEQEETAKVKEKKKHK